MSVLEMEPQTTGQLLEAGPQPLTERENLLAQAGMCLAAAGVTAEKATTLELVGDFYDFNREFALGILRGGQLALEGADVVKNLCPDLPVDKGLVVQASFLTDIGKRRVRGDVVQMSVEGKMWPKWAHEAMKPHARLGCEMALEARLYRAAPILGEHHGAQAEPYGMGVYLDALQRVARDIDSSEDQFEATFMRTNTRNRGMSDSKKLVEVYNHFERFIFNRDGFYGDNGPAIAGALATRYAEVLPAIAA